MSDKLSQPTDAQASSPPHPSASSGQTPKLAADLRQLACAQASLKFVKLPQAYMDLVAIAQRGEMPDFWQVMSALAEVVAFCHKGDVESADRQAPSENMSLNKCRFCS